MKYCFWKKEYVSSRTYLLLLDGVVVSLVNCWLLLLVAKRLALNFESITSLILKREGSTGPVKDPTFNLVPLRLTVWSWYLCWMSECWPTIRARLAGGLEAVESIDLLRFAFGFFDLRKKKSHEYISEIVWQIVIKKRLRKKNLHQLDIKEFLPNSFLK